jgi:voltage-gated potassium channel
LIPIVRSVLKNLEEVASNLKKFYILFKEGKVHQYFLLFLSLVIVSAFLFFVIESQTIAEAIPENDSDSFVNRMLTVFYWSIMTISTTGYGDIVPQTGAGRLLIVLILFSGIVTVSLFTANLASALTTSKLLEGRGIMSLAKTRDHYIICGWKSRMGKFMEEVANTNPSISLRKIIIIANIEPDDIELFRQNYPEFKDVTIIRGDHYNENLLRKANIENAAKVLILSSEEENEACVGGDSMTVLTAMTVRSISVNVTISAELMDVKFEKHLKTAHVDEIVYTTEYSSALMANSLQHIGLTKVINDLLIHHNREAYLKTEKIPEEYCEREFKTLKEYFLIQDGSVLIGLLENVGSLSERKKEAIRVAQKTADVDILVNNLKSAKSLENNQSNLLPEDDYIIPSNSLAIVIWKKR